MTATPTSRLFRPKDADKLDLAHPLLGAVFYKAAELGARYIVDQTTRGRAKQEEAHRTGHSNARFGQSAHNYAPALAGDIYPVDARGRIIWAEQAFRNLALIMFAAAKALHVEIVWGGDWHSIRDLPHFELKNWRELKGRKLAA